MPPDIDDEPLDPRTERLTIRERVGLLERDSRSHARSLTEIVNVVGELSVDMKKLEEWQMTRLLAEAREEERDKALYGRLDRIDTSINGTKDDIKAMRGVWTRILWIAAGVIIPAALLGIALVMVYGVKLPGAG